MEIEFMTEHPFIPYRPSSHSDAEMERRTAAFLATMRTRRTVRDYSSRKIPQTVIENAIREIEKQARTIKSALERKYKVSRGRKCHDADGCGGVLAAPRRLSRAFEGGDGDRDGKAGGGGAGADSDGSSPTRLLKRREATKTYESEDVRPGGGGWRGCSRAGTAERNPGSTTWAARWRSPLTSR